MMEVLNFVRKCVPLTKFKGEEKVFASGMSKLFDVLVDHVLFVHADATLQNSDTYLKYFSQESYI